MNSKIDSHLTQHYFYTFKVDFTLYRQNEKNTSFPETFSYIAANPGSDRGIETIYTDFCRKEYGEYAARQLAPFFIAADTLGILNNIASPVYFAYTADWGRLNPIQADSYREFIRVTIDCLNKEKNPAKIKNLKWLKAVCEFTLLLDEAGRKMEPAWQVREGS